MADAPSLIAYDAARQQIEGGAAAFLAGLPPELVAASLPALTLKRGEVGVEIAVQALTPADFFPLLDLVGPYFQRLGELRRGFRGCSFVADLYSAYDRRKPDFRARKEEPPPPELPPPLEVHFKAEPPAHSGLRVASGALRPEPRGGVIGFEKKAMLAQEEINCILEVFRRFARRDPATVAKAAPPDPAVKLAELGAVVFAPDPDFSEDRVAGYAATKKAIRDTVVLPLLSPEVYTRIGELARVRPGSSVPRAVLFEGPPGTGKTTMARVIASQSQIPMVYVPVESIMSKYYGESEKRLDAIFDAAGELPRSIVFLDEIDAFAGSRETGTMHEATRRLLSVLLRQLQGLVDTSRIVVVGATNAAGDLDPALLSRFNLRVHFPLPDADERAAILARYARHLAPEALAELAAASAGRSGRELEDACGVAERLWASELITSQAAEVTAPPLGAYETAFRLKFRAAPS
ncbi:MAG: ATP-binding protein [Polyangiaceae bacterium]|nr:ATP-binding protein [Polyangiaceae bacterium]